MFVGSKYPKKHRTDLSHWCMQDRKSFHRAIFWKRMLPWRCCRCIIFNFIIKNYVCRIKVSKETSYRSQPLVHAGQKELSSCHLLEADASVEVLSPYNAGGSRNEGICLGEKSGLMCRPCGRYNQPCCPGARQKPNF